MLLKKQSKSKRMVQKEVVCTFCYAIYFIDNMHHCAENVHKTSRKPQA